MAKFIRVFQRREGEGKRELLLNVDHISKIEVKYVEPKDGVAWHVDVESGVDDPAAVRVYRVFVAGEELLLPADPDSNVVQVIEDIYRSAIKG